MPLYMYRASCTAESGAKQLRPPRNRVEAVGHAACEAAGGTYVGGWYCFGDQDIVLLADVPNNERMTAIAHAIDVEGAIACSRTTVLMSGLELVSSPRQEHVEASRCEPADEYEAALAPTYRRRFTAMVQRVRAIFFSMRRERWPGHAAP